MFRKFFSAKPAKKKQDWSKYKVDFGFVEADFQSVIELELVRRVPMKGHEQGLDVWHLKFREWEFKLAIDGSEHAWGSGRVSPSDLLYSVGRKVGGEAEFEQLPERIWFRQIDQMLAIMAEIDTQFAGRDIISA